MKKITLLLIISMCAASLFAQQGTFNTDIFNDLQFTSADKAYHAKLEKNIFNDLTFSDSKKNKITFEKKYLDKYHAGVLSSKALKTTFMETMVRKYKRFDNYVATYAIDIFGDETFRENKSLQAPIIRNSFGELEYASKDYKATFRKHLLRSWVFRDSDGNEVKLSERGLEKLYRKHGSEENVFLFLVNEFL